MKNTAIIGFVLILLGVGLLLYGNSQNHNIGAQLMSAFGGGGGNPGTPWMIVGGILGVIGIILVIVGMSKKKSDE